MTQQGVDEPLRVSHLVGRAMQVQGRLHGHQPGLAQARNLHKPVAFLLGGQPVGQNLLAVDVMLKLETLEVGLDPALATRVVAGLRFDLGPERLAATGRLEEDPAIDELLGEGMDRALVLVNRERCGDILRDLEEDVLRERVPHERLCWETLRRTPQASAIFYKHQHSFLQLFTPGVHARVCV